MFRPFWSGRVEKHASVIGSLLLRRPVGPVDLDSPGCVFPVNFPEGRPGGGSSAAIDMGRTRCSSRARGRLVRRSGDVVARFVALSRPIMRRSLRRPLIMRGNTKRCLSDGQVAVNKSRMGLVLSSRNDAM